MFDYNCTQFLEDMGCDIEFAADNRGKIMDFLLFQAVGLDYKDGGEAWQAVSALETHVIPERCTSTI